MIKIMNLGVNSKDMDKIDRSWLVNFVLYSQTNILSEKQILISQKSLKKENQRENESMINTSMKTKSTLTVPMQFTSLGGSIA